LRVEFTFGPTFDLPLSGNQLDFDRLLDVPSTINLDESTGKYL